MTQFPADKSTTAGVVPLRTVSMQVVRVLLDAVADAGVPRAALLAAAQLDACEVHDVHAKLSMPMFYELLEHALRLTRDPAFGLHSIERMPDSALNPISALVAHAPTLRDAVDGILRFRTLLGDEAGFSLEENTEHVVLRFKSPGDASPPVHRYLAEIAVAGMYRLIKRFRSDARVDLVTFTYGAPRYRPAYRRIFDGRARFGRPFTGLRFNSALMTAAGPHPDAELQTLLQTFAHDRMLALRGLAKCAPYATRVQEFLVSQGPSCDMSMRSTARALGLCERSLRRRLAAEGTRYSDVVDRALLTIARRYLVLERRTIKETAGELGFADTSSFHRAFRRWTGLTPNEFCRQHKESTLRLAGESELVHH
jgi:AraC-like DNA-binding protein